jgi:hypothetical protein
MDQQKNNLTSSQIISKIAASSGAEDYLNFNHSVVGDYFNLKDTAVLEEISFNDCRFSAPFEFRDVVFDKMVSFKYSVFEGPVIFTKVIFNDILDLRSCIFKDQVIFEDIEANSKILINDSEFKQPTEIKRAKFSDDVYFSEAIFEEKLLIAMSCFNDKALFYNTIFNYLEITGCEFRRLFDIACNNQIKNQSINNFNCSNSSFLGNSSFRARKFLGITIFKNLDFNQAPLFANAIFAQDIALNDIRFYEIESEEAEKNYRILKDVLKDCGDDKKSSFFEKLEIKTSHNINNRRTRTFLVNLFCKGSRLARQLIIEFRNSLARLLYAIKRREYQSITRRIFKTNYRKLYNYKGLKNLVESYLRKPEMMRSSKVYTLE